MSSISIRARTQANSNLTTVKVLINHPMEPGTNKDMNGQTIAAHFIQALEVEHQQNKIMQAHWSSAVARNPYLVFRFKGGNKGERIKVTWQDNQGKTDSAETSIG